MADRLWDADPELAAEAEKLRKEHERTRANGDADRCGAPIVCQAVNPHEIASIPPRQWAYGTFLLTGHVSMLGAVDGGGKGAQAVAIAMSMITGQALLGERVWRTGPVAIISYEDDQTEWQRRIAAACLHYHLDYEEVIPQFHFLHRPNSSIRIAAPSPNGTIFPDGDGIIEHLKRIAAVLLILDPLNHAHALEDGNNNVQIAQVAGEVSRIAREGAVAGLVLHHLRKGATGTTDDLMGATASRATFRVARILLRMNEEQAVKLNIPPRDTWRYSRVASSKENYAPPPARAIWYRLESVSLGNPGGIYVEGDNVAVITTWAPPSPFADIPLDVIERIFEAIRQGPANDEHFSPDVRAKNWVGEPIATITRKPDGVIDGIVSTWIENGVLIKGKHRSPKSRHFRAVVTLNEVKVAEILAPLATQLEAADDPENAFDQKPEIVARSSQNHRDRRATMFPPL